MNKPQLKQAIINDEKYARALICAATNVFQGKALKTTMQVFKSHTATESEAETIVNAVMEFGGPDAIFQAATDHLKSLEDGQPANWQIAEMSI